jgi:opacity protein-like surface antigen
MAKYKALIIAGGAFFALARSAGAADLLPPPPALEPPPPAEMAFNGWYLRGDVGIGASANTPAFMQTPDPIAVGGAGYDAFATDGSHNNSISAAGIFDLGVGYQFNNWFRGDITGEYRGGSRLQSLFLINDSTQSVANNPSQEADFYSGDLSSIVGLINGYADLGNWYGVSPYIGAGVGFARNTLSGLSDQSQITNFTGVGSNGNDYFTGPAGGISSEHSRWNFAWALMAGLSFDVTQNLELDLGYRYLDLGKVSSNAFNCLNGSGASGGLTACESAIQSKRDVAYNDFRIGLRWMIGEASYAPQQAPLVRKY